MYSTLTISIPVWLDRIFVIPLLLYRQWKYGCVFRKIPLGQNLFAIVDPCDYYWLNAFHWTYEGKGELIYAVRNGISSNGKKMTIRMHREIMNAPKHLVVDHAGGNTLDNRRTNLRLATRFQNSCNRRCDKTKTTSRFIGVSFLKNENLWRVRINNKNKTITLGRFDNETEAAKAYDEAAKKHRGRFAVLNFN
jgi:hypothetical protein